MATMDSVSGAQIFVACNQCEEPAVYTCDSCRVRFCDNCLLSHLKMGSKEQHVIVDITNKTEDSDSYKCEDHPALDCRIFCKTCDLLMCLVCSATKHNRHDMLEIHQKIEECERTILKENEILRNMLKPIYKINLSRIKSQLSSIPEYYEMQRDHVEQARKKALLNLSNDLEKKADCYKQDLQSMEKEELEEIRSQEAIFTEMLSSIEQNIQNNEKILSSANLKGMLEFKRTSELYTSIPPVKEFIKPEFNEMSTLDIGGFGRISELISLEHSCLRIQLESSQENRGNIQKKPKISWTIDMKSALNVKIKCLIYSIVNITHKRIYVGGNTNFLCLFDFDGNVLERIEMTSSGNFVCLSNDGCILYRDKIDNTVKEIDPSRSISTMILVTKPWEAKGLACTLSGHVYLCLFKKNDSKVSKYTRSGRLEQEIQFDKEGLLLYDDPTCISVNINGDICTTDLGKCMVIVVNRLGVFSFSYKGNVSLKAVRSFCPSCIATDRYGHIFTGDFKNHGVHVIDIHGKFLQFISPQNGLSCPSTLCITENDELVVGEFTSGYIKVIKYF